MFQIQKEDRGDVAILTLNGDMMEECVLPVKDAIEQIVGKDNKNQVVINMGGVEWVNSLGLSAIIAALTQLRSTGGDLRLACVPERMKRPFEITRFDKVFQFFDTIEAAVASFTK
jgi:anti-sigma B factor antagonist